MTTDATYRRIIDAYRGKLMEAAPKACEQVDDLMWASKRTKWVVDNDPVDLDELMTAREIAERFGLEVHNIRAWARRHPDEIHPIRRGSKVLFLLREVLAYRTD